MGSFWLKRYEPFAWLGLCGLLLSGAVSKALHGRMLEAALNGVLSAAALTAGVLALRRKR